MRPTGQTPGERTNRLVKIYTDQVPLTKYEAAMQIVRRAVDADLSDEVITQALKKLAAENRTLTLDSLRVAIYGPPKRGQNSRDPKYTPGSNPLDALPTDYTDVKI